MSAGRRLDTLGKLLGAAVVAGVLVAAGLFPLVGGAGMVVQNAASSLDALPVELTDATPAGTSVMLAANGEPITGFYDENRAPVAPAAIAPVMKQAMVAIEDARFHSHHGLDVRGTLRALVTNLASGEVQEGGSTLTQQLVKQTLLQTADTAAEAAAATEETLARKLREARLALALEKTYSKDEILARYLNIVYFGQNAYGIQAASRLFFSVDAADLTLGQAALLAGLVQSPTNDDPTINPDAATIRRNQVLDRMWGQGMITAGEGAVAQAAPLDLVLGAPPPRGCVRAGVGAFVCDFVQRYLIHTLGLTQQQLEHDGLTIQTTLDPELQRAGDAAVLETLPMGDSLAGLFTAVQPGTGHLLAMSTNRVFGYDVNDPAQESFNLNVAASQGSGSTYKVFTAAAALARQYSVYYTLTTSDPYVSRVYRDGGDAYDVQNVGRYRRTLDLSTALYQSSNTYFLALEDALGSVEEPVRMAEAAGLFQFNRPGLPQQIIDENRGSFTFGAEETSPLGLASAYSTFAAGGTRCLVTPVTAVVDRYGRPAVGSDGQPLVAGDQCTPEAIPAGVATTINQILRRDVEPGNSGQTGSRAYVPGHQIAGKTGTSQDNYSAAFVGSTPEITASVMVLNPKQNQDVGGFGGNKPATIWRSAMAPILDARGSGEFPPADPTVMNGNTKPVPGCRSVGGCQGALSAAGFVPQVVRVDAGSRSGSFLGTSPSAGGRAVVGQVVTIRVSNGANYAPPPPPPPPTAKPAPPAPPAPPAAEPAPPPAAEPPPPPEAPPAPPPPPEAPPGPPPGPP